MLKPLEMGFASAVLWVTLISYASANDIPEEPPPVSWNEVQNLSPGVGLDVVLNHGKAMNRNLVHLNADSRHPKVKTAIPVRAQDPGKTGSPYRVEAFGDFAAVHVRNLLVTNHRDGTGFGAGLGWRPFRAAGRGLGLESRMARIAYDGTPGGDARNYDRWNAWLVAANVLYHFRSSSGLQPYLLGGFGFMRTSGSFRCADCLWSADSSTGRRIYIEDRRSGNSSDHGPILGGGLKVAVTKHFFFRVEFFELFATGGTRWSWNSGSIGMGIRY